MMVVLATTGTAAAQDARSAAQSAVWRSGSGSTVSLTCASQAGERQACPADTSAGVVLVKSTGPVACLLGKTWGYDDTGVWVMDGCSGEFVAGAVAEPPAEKKPPEYVPNAGFLLFPSTRVRCMCGCSATRGT